MQLKSPLNCFRHPMSLTLASCTTMSSGSSHYSLPLSTSLTSDCGLIAFWCLMWIHCATLLLAVGIWCGLVSLGLVLWNNMFFLLSSLIFFWRHLCIISLFLALCKIHIHEIELLNCKGHDFILFENGCLLFKLNCSPCSHAMILYVHELLGRWWHTGPQLCRSTQWRPSWRAVSWACTTALMKRCCDVTASFRWLTLSSTRWRSRLVANRVSVWLPWTAPPRTPVCGFSSCDYFSSQWNMFRIFPWVLWHCCLSDRKGIRPVIKTGWDRKSVV